MAARVWWRASCVAGGRRGAAGCGPTCRDIAAHHADFLADAQRSVTPAADAAPHVVLAVPFATVDAVLKRQLKAFARIQAMNFSKKTSLIFTGCRTFRGRVIVMVSVYGSQRRVPWS